MTVTSLYHFFAEIHHTVEVNIDQVDFLFHDIPRNGTLAGKRIDKVGPFHFLQTPTTFFAFNFNQYDVTLSTSSNRNSTWSFDTKLNSFSMPFSETVLGKGFNGCSIYFAVCFLIQAGFVKFHPH